MRGNSNEALMRVGFAAVGVGDLAAGTRFASKYGDEALEVGSATRYSNITSKGSARYKGEPFAFGIGTRTERSQSLVEEAGKALGIDPNKYVDVTYQPGTLFFTVAGGLRVINIGSRAFSRNKNGQLLEAAHELSHALQFEKFLRQPGGDIQAAWKEFDTAWGSMQYALDEVVAERFALEKVSRYLGGLSSQQHAASTAYINGWREGYRSGDLP